MKFSIYQIIKAGLIPIILSGGYQIFYLATADQLAKSLASRNKQFILFLTTRLLTFAYSFIFTLLVYSDLFKYLGIKKTSELSSEEQQMIILLLIIICFFVWGFFEFIFDFLKKLLPTSTITKKGRYYFNSNSLPNLKLENINIFVLEKINSKQLICYYKIEKEYIRIVLLPSDLNHISIFTEQGPTFLTKIQNHFLIFKENSKKSNSVLFYVFSAIFFGNAYYSFIQCADMLNTFSSPPLFILFLTFIYLLSNILFLVYYVYSIRNMPSIKSTLFLPFYWLKNNLVKLLHKILAVIKQ